MITKLQKNILYNIAHQLLAIILPLITIPYLSRTLGVESNGIYSYTYSIVNYFMIFAMLGISNYGNRRIAKVRDNKEKLALEFSSIYLVQLILGTIVTASYILYCLLFAEYKEISWIEILFLISTILDISWLYFGLEEFQRTALRSIIIKLISVALTLTLVKNNDDLISYTLIMSISALLNQVILWINLKRYLFFKKEITFSLIKTHLKGILILFIPVISYSIYKIMDKIMLGAIYSIDEVAFYEYSEKLIAIPICIINAISSTMLPRMSNLIEQKSKEQVINYIRKTLNLLMFLIIPCCLGLIAIAINFSVLFLGNDYIRTGQITQFLAITVIFTAWANVIRTQWLIPNEKDHIYITTTIIGAIINFVINLFLIPVLGGIGAAIGTICSEFFIMFSQSFVSRHEINLNITTYKQVAYFFATGIIMFIVISLLNHINLNNELTIIYQVCLGVAIYGAMNYKFIQNNIINQIRLPKKLR